MNKNSENTNSNGHKEGDNADKSRPRVAWLGQMPVEILVHILSYLRGPCLAAAGASCRWLHQTVDDDKLWTLAYRRDFGCSAPPPEHADYAQHGKSVRWLYALRAVPPGRTWRDPVTRRQCARILLPNGAALWSGEFSIGIDPTRSDASRCPALLLDGYGAHMDTSGVTCEGIWRLGKFVGPGRSHTPSKSSDDDEVTVRCSSFGDSGGCGHGSIRLGDDLYMGAIEKDTMHGFGAYTAAGLCDDLWGEWANGKIQGRAFFRNSTYNFSGQATNRRRDSVIVPVSGVKRTHEGDLIKGRWDAESRPVWQVEYRASCIVRSNGAGTVRSVHCARSDQGGYRRVRSHTTAIVAEGGHRRADNRDTGGVVAVSCAGTRMFLFVAAPDACSDPCLAGRRFFVTQGRDAGWAPVGKDGAICAPWDLTAAESHAFYRYVQSADCLLSQSDVDTLRTAKASAPKTTDGDNGETDLSGQDDLPPVDGLGLPFGQVVPLGDAGQPLIRCFLTGKLVPATDCVVLSSGRAYSRAAHLLWRQHPHWGKTDPQTGAAVCEPHGDIPWRTWMAGIDVHVLSCAITRAFGSGWSQQPGVMCDIIRFELATLTGRLLDARLHSLMDALASMTQMRDLSDSLLVKDFDGLAMHDIEFRHPDWDPRGTWRLGAPDPALLPEDTTIDDYERQHPDGDPLDHLETHGMVRLALDSHSFVGAQLDGVFFFGHTFTTPSFVGARLTDCLFVDCRFAEPAFAMASITRCRLVACTMRNGTRVELGPLHAD